MKYATMAEAHTAAKAIAQAERALVYIYNSSEGHYLASKERLQPVVGSVNNFLIGEVRPRIDNPVQGLHF